MVAIDHTNSSDTDDGHSSGGHSSESGHILGAGTQTSGIKLFIGFLICCLYLILMGKFLDSLEHATHGTPYHSMLHNIYREIMMVGIGLFAFTLLHETGYDLPYDFYGVYGFVDICSFVMALFFCIQGVFVMVGSLRQAASWELASKIPTEELQLQVNVTKQKSPLLWQWRYFQLCPTRDYVEFRVLHSIFSSVYSMTTRSSEFDFGMYLQHTHEKNILSLTHISPSKWCIILFITAIIALKEILYEHDPHNHTREDVWIFTIGGFISSLFALVLMCAGRISEIRLLNVAGVETISDYTIFLMTEVKTRSALQSLMLDRVSIEECLNEIETEFQTTKTTNEMKERIQQLEWYSRFFGGLFGGALAGAGAGESIEEKNELRANATPFEIKEEDEEQDDGDDEKDEQRQGKVDKVKNEEKEEEGGRSPFAEVAPAPISPVASKYAAATTSSKVYPVDSRAMSQSEEGENRQCSNVMLFTSIEKEQEDAPLSSTNERDEDTLSEQQHKQQPEFQPQESLQEFQPAPPPTDPSYEESHARRSSRRKDVSVLIKVRSRRRSLFAKHSSGAVSSDGTSPAPPPLGQALMKSASFLRHSFRANSSASFRCSWRQSMEEFFDYTNKDNSSSTNAKLLTQKKRLLKEKLLSNHLHQNYEDVFPFFNNAALYYWLVDFSFTTNSLYLAWWALNFVFLASESDHHSSDHHFLPALSLLPALISFLSLTFAIRSTTLLRGLTKIHVSTLLHVMRLSHTKTLLMQEVREKLLEGMRADTPPHRVVTKDLLEVMLDVCRRYSDDGLTLSRSEFMKMLLHYQMIYPRTIFDQIYDAIDVNGGRGIEIGVRRFLPSPPSPFPLIVSQELKEFLFPNDISVENQRREKMFNDINNKALRSTANNTAAKRIIQFIDPKNILNNPRRLSSGPGTGAAAYSMLKVLSRRFSRGSSKVIADAPPKLDLTALGEVENEKTKDASSSAGADERGEEGGGKRGSGC
jgi:hypothetical protein